ncbi:MAG: DUF4393 domain-containing protein [Eubacteriales bacterium]
MINLPEKLPDSIEHVIENTAGPLSKGIGNTFGDLWFLVFGGVSQCAEKRKLKYAHDLELFSQKLIEKYSIIPIDKKIDPDIQITAQALESSKFCIEHEELRAMFANLITSNMNSDLVEYTHPSFPEIIKQMSPLDARNLKLFYTQLPIVELKIYMDQQKSEFYTAMSNIFLENPDEQDIYKQSKSISALQRLGLISIDYTKHIMHERIYEKYENLKPIKIIGFYNEVTTIKGIVEVTPIGKDFMNVCL